MLGWSFVEFRIELSSLWFMELYRLWCFEMYYFIEVYRIKHHRPRIMNLDCGFPENGKDICFDYRF